MNRSLVNFLLACALAAGLISCGGGDSVRPPLSSSPFPTMGNAAPVANAGPNQILTVGSTVTLNASASTDANSDALTYAWVLSAKPAGSASALSDATSVKPTFIADATGIYVATLVVNDGKTNSAASTVIIDVAIGNIAPVANAGSNQILTVGSTVALNASASTDANSDALTYAWVLSAKPAGSASALIGATSVNPTFVADTVGIYVATLVVNDGKTNSAASTITINVVVGNAAPVLTQTVIR